MTRSLTLALVLAAAIVTNGCSLQKVAVNKLGNALAAGGDVFSSDDDPELIGDAVPFSLKLMESLLAESPRHAGLLLSTCRGFTQYSYGWIHQKGAELEDADLDAASFHLDRARRMYLRARDYGLRGLELRHAGITRELTTDPVRALSSISKNEVPLLYWSAASWGLAISLSKDQPEMVADLPIVEAMIDRALALDEAWQGGAIHSFLISYELSRLGVPGDASERARSHFDRAVQLSDGQLANPFINYAESVSVAKQNRAQFEELLDKALAIDPAGRKEWRLENILAQRRARWLITRKDHLFLTDEPSETNRTSENTSTTGEGSEP